MNSVKNSKVSKKRPFYNFAYDFVRITGAIPAFIWFRFKVHRPSGTKLPNGAVLIVANHNSMMDPIIMNIAFLGRRMHSLATSDLFRTKFAAKFFDMMHCIKVDKKNFSVATFRSVSDRLEEGKAVLIFPEGQINRETEMLAFKSGAVLMAFRAKSTILPVYIATREKWLHRQHVVVGDPIDVAGQLGATPSMNDFQSISDQIRQQELWLMDYYETQICSKK